MGSTIVAGSERAKSFLPSRIPDGQLSLVTRHIYNFGLKVNSCAIFFGGGGGVGGGGREEERGGGERVFFVIKKIGTFGEGRKGGG